ncbi:uncharacterized protein [Argopecten irradians]|uniref:uncharacterized protein isoform X1 n=1 Tax=Argopecten irradians TaxID=31199 RepID=UPI00371DA5B3
MTSQYVERALLKISNGNPRQIYNILIEIRTKVVKSQTGIRELIKHGFVHKSLFLLSDDVRKQQLPQTTDIILSVLGNLCMEEKAREDVHKSGGIPTLAELFCTSESVSIQNRSCRALSNAAQLPVNADAIFSTDTVDRVVELLELTPSKESKLIYCRIIRLLGKTQKNLDRLVAADAVRCIVKLLTDEDRDVKSAALRMVFETSNQGCSSTGFTSQVVSAGGISELLSGVADDDSTVAHQSFTTLIRLCDQAHARAELGNAGGITKFIDYFEGLGNFDKDKRFSVLNVLCLCCKDVVNRVKIRDNNILPKFLDCLKDTEYKRLHDRVISALLCFLYDESSLELLLQNSLIQLLLAHLQRVAGYTSVVVKLDEEVTDKKVAKIDLQFDSSKLDMQKAESENVTNDEKETLRQRMTVMTAEEEKTTVLTIKGQTKSVLTTEEQVESILTTEGQTHSDMATERQTKSGLTSIKQGPSNLDEDEEVTASTEKKYHYSIDSPTYQVTSEWNLDTYSQGAKCKSFNRDPTSPQYSNTSPLSTISYYSPSLSPGDFSSPTSPVMSKVNEDPDYGLVCSLPFSCQSPGKQHSPGNMSGLSPSTSENETGSYFQAPMVYSDEEESQEATLSGVFPGQSEGNEQELSNKVNIPQTNEDIPDSKVENVENSDQVDERKENSAYFSQGFEIDGTNKYQLGGEVAEHRPSSRLHFDFGGKTIKIGSDKKNKLPPVSPETLTKEHVSKKPKLSITRRRSPTATENHILMIVSFVSQMPDPTKFLVSTDVLCCLLDYIGCVQIGETRAARVLCRLARNPNCFEKLIRLNLPWIVYEKLLSKEDDDQCWIKILHEKHSGLENRRDKHHRSRSLSLCSDDSSVLEEDLRDFSSTDGKIKSPKTSRSARNSLNNSITQNTKNSSSSGSVSEDEEEITLSSRAGINVLQDLCRMADSPYGRGVLAHILSRQSASQMHTLISLLYILWTRCMWNFYLFKKGLWKEYMDILTAGPYHPYHPVILEAFCFLGKVINFDIKLRNEQCEKLFVANLSASNEKFKDYTCKHRFHNHDIQFTVNRTASMIPACKETLARASPLFAAMLQGKYSESTQNIVTLKDTSYYAVRFVVHYFHGCDLDCDVISDILTCEPCTETWSQCVEVLRLVNRYLVSDLEPFLQSVLSTRFLGPRQASDTYSFAKLHSYEVLATDCVKIVLVGGKCVNDRMQGLNLFLNGPDSERFLSHLEQLFKSSIH